MRATIRRATPLALTLAVLALVAAPVLAATTVGQVVGDGATLDGVAVPSGTTLLSPSAVQTAEEPVILHLRNGQALTVDPETSTELESVDNGEIRLTVDRGAVALREPSGAVMTLAANSQVVLDAQGQIGEGARVTDSTAKLCQLSPDSETTFAECSASPEAAAGCDWQLIEAPANQVDAYLGESAVWAGVENNDLGLDENCEPERAAGAPPADGGLSTRAKAGIGLGIAAATYFAVDEIDDDDERPASPIQP